MNKTLATFRLTASALIVVSLAVSCMPSASKSSLRGRGKSGLVDTSTLNPGEGRVMLQNPVVQSNNKAITPADDFTKFLTTVEITDESFLQSQANCYNLTYCFEIFDERNAPASLQTTNGKWGYHPTSKEFTQVNTFYHLNLIFNRFIDHLKAGIDEAYNLTALRYNTSLNKDAFKTDGQIDLNDTVLKAIANCDLVDNAAFEPAKSLLCFGFTNTPNGVLRWAHDDSLIYHEAGHFFQDVQLNFRNPRAIFPYRVQLGSFKGYTEAASLGEGLSDYFSYFINGRTHFAEWAAGRYLEASRPLTESDPLHVAGISSDRDQRLAYPDYLSYNPNDPATPHEEIHNGGMIMAHFLVALTEDIKTRCTLEHRKAADYVMLAVTETLAELGDINTHGTEAEKKASITGKVNLNPTYALHWFNTVNPVNYRSFTQTFAKNILINLGNPTLARCNGGFYPQDELESLLDDYGLLLFKTYNQHRNLTNGTTKVNTPVTPTNRKKSVLVSKNAVTFDPAPDASLAFVYDDQKELVGALEDLGKAGIIPNLSDDIKDGLPYNNGNAKVSPGEFVGLALNLYNNSNSTIAGVQILANDWDHADTTPGPNKGRPCQFSAGMSNDTWPLESEGGSVAANCNTVSASTPDDFAPICFVQSNESSATKWISQSEFRTKLALDTNFCLNKSSDKDCFVRAVRDLDSAYLSKLNPKSNWTKTFTSTDPKVKAPKMSYGNLVFLEVSKHVPPGTVIDCRFRVRFTNCEDCFHDGSASNNDYKDSDYNGPKPFKVFHLQIPITD